MNKMKKALYVLLGVALLCAACGSDEKKRIVSSKGLPYELLVVVEPSIWNSAAGDSLRQILEGPVPGLPQHENMFRLVRVAPKHYDRMYVTMRNKLFVRLDDKQDKPLLGMARDVEATPQIEVTLTARSIDDLAGWLGRNKEMLADVFVDAELDVEAARLRKKHSKKVADDLKALAGYTLCAPEDIKATKRGEDFLWGGTNRNDKDYNVVFYSYPLEGAHPFDPDEFVRKRDSVMKINIPGSTPEKWMTTTVEGGHPLVGFRRRRIGGQEVLEAHGLWEMHKGGIGGPFVSLVRADSAAGRVVVCEGFVYSPRTNKRDLMRTLEASLRTLVQEKH